MMIVKKLFAAAGASLLIGTVLAGCLTIEEGEPEGVEAVSEAEAEVVATQTKERAICDGLECDDPDGAAEVCEELWGATSDKTYHLLSQCEAGGTTTNSDCFSDCFRNYCQCGSTAGTPNACDPAVPPPDAPNCHCFTSGIVSHRFWCCGEATTTIHGWSDTDYCSNIVLPGAWMPGTTVIH